MERTPHTVVWEYTLECDSKCLHCGSNALKVRPNELTTEEAKEVVKQIKDTGFKFVVLSGGEPTLRKDWDKTVREIQDSGMQAEMISNALAWDQAMIDRVAGFNMFSLGFSVDGEQKNHDYLRGVEGSHKKIFDTIRELKKRNQTVCAVTSVNKLNFEDLSQIRNRLIVYGVDAWQIQMASPMGRMKHHQDIVLDGTGYQQLAEFCAETRERLRGYMNIAVGDCIGYYGQLEGKLRRSEWHGCGAGLSGLGIRANGDVVGCLSIWKPGYVEGNLRERTLKEIWEDPDSFSFNRNFKKADLKGQCTSCDYGEKCKGGCSSQSVAFSGEFHNAPYCLSKIEGKSQQNL